MNTSTNFQQKTKICLSDYLFQRDVEARLFLAKLSSTEIEILREIIHHSLKIQIEQLAAELDLRLETLIPILDKLSEAKLFSRQYMTLVVDKEMRKYLETQIEKFDDDFRPDVDFFQSLLGHIPIHLLPSWYAIPRTSDNIFDSIIEKHFLTPKIYRRYLHELNLEDPILHSIIHEVHSAPTLKVSAHELMERLHISHSKFEECLLQLEFHFICCLSYEQQNDRWEEVVTPFAEWREVLDFEYCTRLKPIPEEEISKDQETPFAYIDQISSILEGYLSKGEPPIEDSCSLLIEKLVRLDFLQSKGEKALSTTDKGREWLTFSIEERAAALANEPLSQLDLSQDFPFLWNGRNLNLIEKSLRRLPSFQWVTLDNFVEGVTAPIGDRKSVSLKKTGRKWRYTLPSYTDQEKLFMKQAILERLSRLGIVNTGTYRGLPCLSLTSFGSLMVH